MGHTIRNSLKIGAIVAGCVFATNQGALADGGKNKPKMYSVTVTNALHGQPLAPGMLATHDRGYRLFELGDEPSVELATMAETGDPGALAGLVGGEEGVSDVAVLVGSGPAAPITLPSESNSIEISASSRARFLTVVGMLAATNDAFYAAQGVPLPRNGSITVYANAYDAGSEANNETNGDVPASPLGNSLDAGVKAGDGEGFIHIHPGIHGGADLTVADHDWRNPVVKITIERIK